MPRCLPSFLALALASTLIGCAETPERPAPERRPPPAESAPTQPPPRSDEEPPNASQDETADRGHAKKRRLSISLADQSFVYSEDGETVRTGPISSGAPGYPTPTGRFKVLSKDEDKVSSRYTNQLGMQAWMPYSIQFHGNYFLHEGWLPGYPDSHGCVRVGEPDARFLFGRLEIGDPVILTD
ncbi:L,D-transpeptidase [Imhoffiella purpurea]|uniref:ErfK/YbiS/YcfS/YnhG n=1 Tax=Imhoffiella purpurea TaxID=1249627 RepID=W9VF19_9GAMM|nr:L,D-transpeptidase [Imhoffiella purpurea]EXJ14637.1 ErfK/YbiS/YcfS/YnhG [Imhoffiella purpurea]